MYISFYSELFSINNYIRNEDYAELYFNTKWYELTLDSFSTNEFADRDAYYRTKMLSISTEIHDNEIDVKNTLRIFDYSLLSLKAASF